MFNSAKKNKQYILYGASFNPPHIGHFYAIQQMLEVFDKVVVFPFPHKYQSGQVLSLPPLRNRMRMLELFFKEFFPKVAERLILANLSSDLKHKDQVNEGNLHTYDYLCYLRNKVSKDTDLTVCLGVDHKLRKVEEDSTKDSTKDSEEEENPSLRFHRYEDIYKEFGIYKIPDEESRFKSEDIRSLLAKPFSSKDDRERRFLVRALGVSLSEYIRTQGLYAPPAYSLKISSLKISRHKISR